MIKYQAKDIEAKWRRSWKINKLYTSNLKRMNKFYVLAEFAYTSGDLHMGHWFTFAGADAYARSKRMQGYQVFFPNGFDAFGLPAENAAIRRGIHPKEWTLTNVELMRRQFGTMAGSFSFDHEVITCLPEYYKWNQWIFIRLYERGLAYRGKYISNWCESCQTVLAHEAVEGGSCWRCRTQVIQKEVEQWFFKITDYADRLIWPQNHKVEWPKALRDSQNDWIGRSEGVEIEFEIEHAGLKISTFTIYPETVFGVTYLVLAPEHPLIDAITTSQQKQLVKSYIRKALDKSELERKTEREKTGVFTGSFCINPVNNAKVPIWVADYVIATYGTGAVMGVPGSDHRDFAFAKKYHLPIIKVIAAKIGDLGEIKSEKDVLEEGFLVNSGKYDGLESKVARLKISDYILRYNLGSRRTSYHLRDWSVSRQRYWGTPVPMIHCSKCGIVPVPDKDLPVELPEDVDYTPKGKPPLATNEAWMKVKCPKCKAWAKRDPETLDAFVDSAWYFLRYLDPKYKKGPFDATLAKKIMPVDVYFGGAEHTVGHTLYSRFLVKFFYDYGLVDFEEYALRRINHGVVLGPDGARMSKSKGNVVNPDDEVKKYGADCVRVYLAFFMPYEGTGPWVPERVWGAYRFLERVWQLFDKVDKSQLFAEDLLLMHKTIKKVGDDIETINFNTAVASLMEWLNYLGKKEKVAKEEYKTMLLLLAPFAPHITEELWSMLGEAYSIHQQSWPKYDQNIISKAKSTVVVQVNGKFRSQIVVEQTANQQEVEDEAFKDSKVTKFIKRGKIKSTHYVPGKILNIVLAD